MTEGGIETEIMYRHGFELPEFAMFPLLENPEAVGAMRQVLSNMLDVAAEFGLSFMLTGLDYRASPDWGAKLGYSPSGLAEANIASIEFLREIAKPYVGQIPQLLIGGCIGPRGDAYGLNTEITAESADDYHSVQLETLKAANRLRGYFQQHTRSCRRISRCSEDRRSADRFTHAGQFSSAALRTDAGGSHPRD